MVVSNCFSETEALGGSGCVGFRCAKVEEG